MTAGAVAGAAATSSGEAIVVTISDQTVNAVGGSTASAGIKLTRGGQFHTGESTTTLDPDYIDVGGGEWASTESAAVGDNYEAMLETTTGTLSNGTADSWLALTSDREWDVGRGSVGTSTFTGTLKIRTGGIIQDTAAIELTVTVGF